MAMGTALLTRNGAQISATRAVRLVREGALLLDVRRGGEWREGHATGAVHIPLDELPDRMMSLPGDRSAVVLCRNGVRSRAGARLLARGGYLAWSVRGGLPAWAGAGGPVTVGQHATLAAQSTTTSLQAESRRLGTSEGSSRVGA